MNNGILRDAAGRFRPGTAGGPGPRAAGSSRELRSLIRASFTEEDKLRLIDVLKKKAFGGSWPAARILMELVAESDDKTFIDGLAEHFAKQPPDDDPDDDDLDYDED
jgi:hypothetical protein